MITIKATLDDWSSLDGKTCHRKVTVRTEHQQVHIATDNGGDIALSRAAIQTIAELVGVK